MLLEKRGDVPYYKASFKTCHNLKYDKSFPWL